MSESLSVRNVCVRVGVGVYSVMCECMCVSACVSKCNGVCMDVYVVQPLQRWQDFTREGGSLLVKGMWLGFSGLATVGVVK